MSVAFVAVGAAAVGTIYSSSQASKAANNATNQSASAAEDERVLARETLDYYRERDTASNALQADANKVANRVGESQIALMDQSASLSREYAGYNRNTFRPLEQGIVAGAQAFDTEARRNQAAGRAMADVSMQSEIARQAQTRAQQRMGVNPSSGRAMAMGSQMAQGEALAKASAATNARQNVETQGFARKMDAASLGRNLPSAQSAAVNSATQAGNSAIGAAYAPGNAAKQSTNIMGGAMQNFQIDMSGANRLGINAANQTANLWGQSASGFSSMAGTLAGQYAARR